MASQTYYKFRARDSNNKDLDNNLINTAGSCEKNVI